MIEFAGPCATGRLGQLAAAASNPLPGKRSPDPDFSSPGPRAWSPDAKRLSPDAPLSPPFLALPGSPAGEHARTPGLAPLRPWRSRPYATGTSCSNFLTARSSKTALWEQLGGLSELTRSSQAACIPKRSAAVFAFEAQSDTAKFRSAPEAASSRPHCWAWEMQGKVLFDPATPGFSPGLACRAGAAPGEPGRPLGARRSQVQLAFHDPALAPGWAASRSKCAPVGGMNGGP